MVSASPAKKFVPWNELGDYVERLANLILSKGESPDLVVGIARGGIPLAMVVADRLGVPIDFVNVKSYAGIHERGPPKILSTLVEDIRGRSVLVVDDLVDEGDTMDTILAYLAKLSPKKLITAVLFIKPWSRFKPDFYLETVDRWVVFPWELREFGEKTAPTSPAKAEAVIG